MDDISHPGSARRKDGNPRYTQAAVRKQIDGILHDIALGFEIGENVDGGIGDEKRLRMGRDVHDENVTEAPRRAQTRCRGGHRAHEFVGMQAALYQDLALGFADQLNCSCCGRLTVRRGDGLP